MAPKPKLPPKKPTTANPVEYTYHTVPSSSSPNPHAFDDALPRSEPLSVTTHHIAGIMVHVHGLSELPPQCTQVTILWLLHPRLQTHECMFPFAAHIIRHYYSHIQSTKQNAPSSDHTTGMIAVSFDQRNHGVRLHHPPSNEAWRSGNPRHGPDMFGQYAGTALDVTQILDYLPAYIFPPPSKVVIQRNLLLGISLGGHASWHVLMNDTRFAGACIVVGCPDYTRLMVDRARLSKRRAWVETKGEKFVGSVDWPEAFVEVVMARDPAGRIARTMGRKGAERGEVDWEKETTGEEVKKLKPWMQGWLGGKKVLLLNGGADKLVGYAFSKPFLGWLKKAVGSGGWWEGGMAVEDVVFEGVGHEVPSVMVPYMLRWVVDIMDGDGEGFHRRDAKI